MRFSGHESFACRYAWLPKAFRAISEDPSVFADEERAMVTLGVGKNMVRSIRFWVEAMDVASAKTDRTFVPSEFGQAIFATGGFDPYLEDLRTLWLLHWKVASRTTEPLFAWEFLLNNWPYAELTRSEALTAFSRETRRLNLPHSEVTLAQHLDVFLHTYLRVAGARGAFEDTLDCPLAELELLQLVGEHRVDGTGRREPVYAFRREAKPEISTQLFEYCLNDYWSRRSIEATLNFRDLATAPGGVGLLLKLPEDDVRARLDVYAAPNCTRPFSYQPSAIQGRVSRRSGEPRDFLAAVYEAENGGE